MHAAELWRRTLAGALDVVLLAATAGLLNVAVLALTDTPALLADASGLAIVFAALDLPPSQVFARLLPFVAMSTLYLGLFWGLTGRTLGARVLKIRVVHARGERPGPLHTAARVLGSLLGLGLGGLGWLWAAIDPDRRAWHDHLANTYVVRSA